METTRQQPDVAAPPPSWRPDGSRSPTPRASQAGAPSPDASKRRPLTVAGHTLEDLADRLARVFPGERARPRLTASERADLAVQFDALLRLVFRAKGALALRIGEYLHWLDHGDRLLTVGYHRMTDFAREECGLPASDARSYRRMAVALESRPLLREAVQSGEVSPVKVERVKKVAVGAEERAWVERAKMLTVRALTDEVRLELVGRELGEDGAGGGGAEADAVAVEGPEPAATRTSDPDEEPVWVPVEFAASRDDLTLFRRTVALARRSLGADTPRGRCVEAMAQELLSSTAPPQERVGGHGLSPRPRLTSSGRDPSPDLRPWLEAQTRRWAFLDHGVPTVEGEGPITDLTDPFAVREEVVRLADLMRGWDVLACRLSLLLRYSGLWRDLRFQNLHHYATERLGLSGRAIEQRAWLETKMFDWRALRAALEDGTLCYARALEVARAGGAISIEWATGHSVIEIRHRADEVEDAKMLDRGRLRILMPEDALDVVDDALRALQAAAERAELSLDADEAFWLMVLHAYRTWEPLTPRPEPLRRRLEARKWALCEAYGCTMPGIDMHHVDLRSHQGPDGPENRVLLCRPHHQRGAHGPGHTQIEALGDERFEWRFGCRPGAPPLRVVITGGPERDPDRADTGPPKG